MNIDWNPSQAIRQRAIKISEMKEKGYTYAPLRDFFGLSRNYIIALKKYGDKLRGIDPENKGVPTLSEGYFREQESRKP